MGGIAAALLMLSPSVAVGEIGPAPARPLEQQLYPGLQAVWKRYLPYWRYAIR